MQVTSASFQDPTPAAAPMVLRLRVEGSGFLHRAAPVVAVVGNVLVEAIVVNLAGDRFTGLLGTVPPAGATLKVGYLDTDLVDTNIVPTPGMIV